MDNNFYIIYCPTKLGQIFIFPNISLFIDTVISEAYYKHLKTSSFGIL